MANSLLIKNRQIHLNKNETIMHENNWSKLDSLQIRCRSGQNKEAPCAESIRSASKEEYQSELRMERHAEASSGSK